MGASLLALAKSIYYAERLIAPKENTVIKNNLVLK